MSNTAIYNNKGEKVGDLKISDKIFGVKISKDLVHQAAVTQMANERQVLAHTKGRAEVRGGGKKPWKQKGTGRARAGSSRSPIWIGGGVTFGPTKDRNFSKKINRKMKQKALFMVLSDKVDNNNFVVLDKFEIKEFKTKNVNEILSNLEKIYQPTEKVKKIVTEKKADAKEKNKKPKAKKQKRSILIINDKKDDKAKYSVKNLADVKLINLNNINIVDLLKYKSLILTVDAVKKMEEKYK